MATWCEELTHWKRPWCWERLKAGGDGDDREWDDWMASPTHWTWVWVNSGSLWWTGRPGVLRLMGSQRVEHDWVTELTDWLIPSLKRKSVRLGVVDINFTEVRPCLSYKWPQGIFYEQFKLTQSFLELNTICFENIHLSSGSYISGTMLSAFFYIIISLMKRLHSWDTKLRNFIVMPNCCGQRDFVVLVIGV